MCDKCLELDKKIERYHRLQFGINDQFAKEGLEQLIRGSDGSKARFASRVEASKAVANVTPDSATITATMARKVRAPGVPMVHIAHRHSVPAGKIKAGMKKWKHV